MDRLDAGHPLLTPLFTEVPWPLPALWVRGDLRPQDRAAAAVVGSRAATPYGLRVASRLAGDLARSGLTVVSGLALGIDAAAHRGALAAGGRTLAVLGSGVDVVAPVTNAGLADAIAGGGPRSLPPRGALLSPYPPGTPPAPHRYPERNAVVAALSAAVVVVEADARSGALITARLAAEAGREVFVVPPRLGEPRTEGLIALLRDGARPYLGVEEVVEEAVRLGVPPAAGPPDGDQAPAGPLGADAPPAGGGAADVGKAAEADPPDPPDRLLPLLRALEGNPCAPEEAAAILGADIASAAAGLLELEVLGLARSVPGGRYAVA